MKRCTVFLIVAVGGVFISHAQQPPIPPPGYNPSAPAAPIVEEVPPMRLVEGKPADTLSEEEVTEFLEQKIKTINHEDGHVELLRVAPGYPLTLTFEEIIREIVVGERGVANVRILNNQRQVLIEPRVRTGDMSIQIFFPGDKLRVYHLFIAEDFTDGAETAIRVVSFGKSPSPQTFGITDRGHLDIRTITQVIRNYDALKQEKAVDHRMLKRFELFRKSRITSFTTFYIYRFASGPVAITFAYQNPYPYPVRYDESRLRIAIGNVRYIPNYVSFHKTTLPPGQTTTGFAVIANPAFSTTQPFELVWN